MSSLRRSKTNGESSEDLGGQMSFLEHLDELRKRLIRSMAFVLVAAFACWFLSDRIYNFLARPVLQALANAQQRQVQIDGLNGQQTSAPLSSLSVPYLLGQSWDFVSPGLYPHERKYVTPFIALSSIFFILGTMVAYYRIFPPAAKYLLGLGQDFRLLLKA